MVSKRKKLPKRKPRLKTPVCKPCWELKYCPYGPLVEFFPLSPEDFSVKQIKQIHADVTEGFAKGQNRTEREILSEVERFLWSEPGQWEHIQQSLPTNWPAPFSAIFVPYSSRQSHSPRRERADISVATFHAT